MEKPHHTTKNNDKVNNSMYFLKDWFTPADRFRSTMGLTTLSFRDGLQLSEVRLKINYFYWPEQEPYFGPVSS